MTHAWITPELMQRLAGSLLHFVWQGAVIALIAAIGFRLLRQRSAEARYAWGIVSLLFMLAAPMLTVAFYSQVGSIAQRLIEAMGQASLSGPSVVPHPLQMATWAQRILFAWSAGVVIFAVRLVVGWRLSWALVKSAEQLVPPAVVRIFESVRDGLGLRESIRLLTHSQLDSPVVVGWLRPVVLLPVSLISGFSEEQLTAILAHELAHIRRHDFLVNVLQRCVESILFYHPAAWWLSKRIRAEREHCCDDVAVRVCGSRRAYAEALIEMERARQTRPILAVAAADGVILDRFRRVLGMKSSAVDWQSAIGTLLFVGVWMVVGMWQSSTIVQASPTAFLPPPVVVTEPSPIAASVNAIAAIMTAQPVPAPQQQVSNGSIQGVVTRAGTSEPIPGALVRIANAPFDPDALSTLLKFWEARGVTMSPQEPAQSDEKYFQSLMDKIAAKGLSVSLPENAIAISQFRAMNTARYTTTADANGRFAINDLASGEYTLQANRQGFFEITGRPVVGSVDSAKPTNVAVPMLAGGTITGRVRNATGKALPNANVTAYRITYVNGKIIPLPQSSQMTDDRGEYRMFWLTPGDYVVLADPPRYPVSGPASGPVVGGPGVAVPAPGTLSTPQFMRTFYPQSLTTADAGIIAVKSGDQLSGMDINVQKATTYKISGDIHLSSPTVPVVPARGLGEIADTNAPQRIQLGLEFRNPSVVDMRSTNQGGAVPSIGAVFLAPGQDGLRATFEVRDILPGEYYLVPRAIAPIPTLSGLFQINRVAIDVRDKDITGLAIELSPMASVNGTLTVDGRAPGNITARVALNASGNPSPTYQGISARAVVAKADDGTFSIANVPPTHYRLETGVGLPPDLYVSDVRMGAISVFDSGFEFGKQPPGQLQVSLRSGAGIVDGVVRDGFNKPISNATVVVVPPDARRENRELYKTAKSDASGKFTIRGIAPGSYKVFAFEGLTGGEFYNARFLSKHEFRGRSINVTQGGTVTESLTLIESN